ncbi:MAG TPA: VOC family protein [Kofleriaceae bacterium]|jgi:predicted enzyme related to lactoylglutathione lyase
MATQPAKHGLQISHTSLLVDDQDKALAFYTGVLGFQKKADFSNNGYRWLTVSAGGDTELQLQLAQSPEAKAYQAAMLAQSQPAAMFYTDDVKADAERIKTKGAELTMPPTDVTYAWIAVVKDTAGNVVQLTQLKH